MTSLVLARKYRPRSFGEMVGQEHVVRALANALGSQRLHHAYLFTGTRGVGKTTVSRILAKSLNCIGPDGQGGITAEPCGTCRPCTEIDADRFIDYVEMDAASNRGIDEIRDLLERAAYKPAVGRFKVFMIDEVHQLTKDSFNALLKTLEEPPEYLKFVLATTDPEKVLPTVLSRCLQFNLRPMAPETVLGRLQHVLDAEQMPAEPGALRLIARAARGSMRDALSLADQAIAFGAGALTEDGVRQMLGSVDRSHVFALIEALADGAGARVVQAVDEMRAQGLSAEGALEEMAVVLQQMAVLQAVPGALDEQDPDTAAVVPLAARLPADETQLLYSIALHGRGELPLAPDEYSGLVMVLLRMLAFRPAGAAATREPAPPRREPAPAAATASARAGPVTAVTASARAGPVTAVTAAAVPLVRAAAAASVSVAAAPPPIALRVPESGPPPSASRSAASESPHGDRWAALVAQLLEANAITALVRELALQSECIELDADERRFGLRVERESLRNPAHAERLEAAIAAALGHPVRVDVQAGEVSDTPARRDAAERERRQREAEALIHNDPLVLQLTAQFKTARIVPGSIKPL